MTSDILRNPSSLVDPKATSATSISSASTALGPPASKSSASNALSNQNAYCSNLFEMHFFAIDLERGSLGSCFYHECPVTYCS